MRIIIACQELCTKCVNVPYGSANLSVSSLVSSVMPSLLTACAIPSIINRLKPIMTGASPGSASLEERLLRPRSRSAISVISNAVCVTPVCSHSKCVFGIRAVSGSVTRLIDFTAYEISALDNGFVSRSTVKSKANLLV